MKLVAKAERLLRLLQTPRRHRYPVLGTPVDAHC
jgi:hypothetical protein